MIEPTFEGTSVFYDNETNKPKSKSFIRRLSIGAPKEKKLHNVEENVRKLSREIDGYRGSRKDRRYSDIQSKLIRNSFEVEKLRKSFKRRNQLDKLNQLQAVISENVRKMEEVVDKHERNGVYRKAHDKDNFLNEIENELLKLLYTIEDTPEHLETIEKHLLTLQKALHGLKFDKNSHQFEKKSLLLDIVLNCKTKIDVLKNGEENIERVVEKNLLKETEDNLSVFLEEITSFMNWKRRQLDEIAALEDPNIYQVQMDLKVINQQIKILRRYLKSFSASQSSEAPLTVCSNLNSVVV